MLRSSRRVLNSGACLPSSDYRFFTITSFALNCTTGSQIAGYVTGFVQFIKSSPAASYKGAPFAAVCWF